MTRGVVDGAVGVLTQPAMAGSSQPHSCPVWARGAEPEICPIIRTTVSCFINAAGAVHDVVTGKVFLGARRGYDAEMGTLRCRNLRRVYIPVQTVHPSLLSFAPPTILRRLTTTTIC